MHGEHETSQCGCPCHMMMGIFVVLLGLTFLLGNVGVLTQYLVGILWPSIVILAGLKKMFAGKCKCCAKS